MADVQTVQRCRWAEPTLFLDDPSWTNAADFAWSCCVEGSPNVIDDPERCADCPRFVGGSTSRRGRYARNRLA